MSKLQAKHILVIERDGLIGGVLTAILKKHYKHVSHAESGKEALEEIRRKPPDIIVLNLKLQDMSGLELARAVRQNEKTKSIPILAMSDSPGDQNKCLEAGCNGFILTPFNIPELLNELAALLPS